MYKPDGTLTKQNNVEQYAPLVKRIAYQLVARLPANIMADDLIQSGMMGLLDAMSRFQSGMGAQFETYAVTRIRGAMLDSLRENDTLPRSARRELRRMEDIMRQLEHQEGRKPLESEIAKAMDLPLNDYQKLLSEAREHQLLYLEDMVDPDDETSIDRFFADKDSDPLRQLIDGEEYMALVKAIGDLPEREQMIMSLYYEQELNLREIGEVLEVTESQIHK